VVARSELRRRSWIWDRSAGGGGEGMLWVSLSGVRGSRDIEARSILMDSRSRRRVRRNEAYHVANHRFAAGLVSRRLGLLLFVLLTVVLSASAASGYDLAAGGSHTCVIDDNGVTCWGRTQYSPTAVPAGLLNPRAVIAGREHTCTIDDNGVTCWGRDLSGQATVPPGLPRVSGLHRRHVWREVGALPRGEFGKGRFSCLRDPLEAEVAMFTLPPQRLGANET